MKIGIDAHSAERDGRGNCTYIRNILKELSNLDTQNEYVLYVTNIQHPFYQNFRSCKNFQLKKLAMKNPFIRIPFALAWETLKDGLDILHVQYISPPFYKGKLVATIHDLGFIHIPESFSKFEVFRSKILVRMTAKKSHKIIAGSNFSKNDIVQSYGIDPEKIEVIPYGVSPSFRSELDPLDIQKVLSKYNIQTPYILSVGRLNPRKNLISLFKAFSMLKKEKFIPHKLVIVGKKDFKTRKIIQSIEKLHYKQDISIIGFVSDQDLPYLYNGADAFLYPSLFEGVGLPVLEAMRAGVPVIVSNLTSLTEIVGDAGMLVNPLDQKDIGDAMYRIISDQDLKRKYISRGISRAKKLTWLSTAQQTLNIYTTMSRRDTSRSD